MSLEKMVLELEAISDEKKAIIRQHFEQLGMECMKDNPITSDDIASLRAKKVPSGPNAPCFLACVLKKSGVMDESGMLQKENILEKARKVFDDEDELKSIEGYLHSCSHINSEAVSDGEKGCERAVLSIKCMIDNAAQFGFDI
uniref:Odorant Binding Protein n=1 Tax=Epiphyas postvittana TaxID=65032 RepID=A0A0K8TUB6_EPIPO